jgi:predicted metal-dependent enzyme (double-stranded beta helix superfamily)
VSQPAPQPAEALQPLTELAERALDLGDVERTVDALRGGLCELIGSGRMALPERVGSCVGGHYARRLLHRDERRGYSVIAMTWGAAQGTPLHDHAGLWCVESVWRGSIEVLQYELLERQGERFRFEKCGSIQAGIGSAGCLIPPHEYHVIRNPSMQPAVSIHIYGGDMTFCNVFEQEGGGWFRRRERPLGLDD